MGKVFWTGIVAEMGDRDDSAARAGLHELARKELVRAARTSSVKDQAEYSFWHALVRDVAYSQIPRADRAQKHIAAAGGSSEWPGERVTDHAELLAYHYTQALDLTRAVGTTAGEELRTRSPALSCARGRSGRRRSTSRRPTPTTDEPSKLFGPTSLNEGTSR